MVERVKSKVSHKLVLSVSLLTVLLFPDGSHSEIIEKIVAVVNEEIITLSEMRDISVPYLERMKTKFSVEYGDQQIMEVEQRILDQLIEEKLTAQEAEKSKIEVSERDVDLAIRDMREDNKLTETQFAELLAGEGISFEEYREQLKGQMKTMRLLEQEVKSKVNITEDEIKEYYKKHKERYNTPPEVRLQQILIMIPPKASEQEISQLKAKAEEVLQRIREGEDFNAMVALYSQDSSAKAGGDMGFFREGELLPEIDKIAFSLGVGEVGPLIQTSTGFHIVRVLEKREKQKMPVEERLREIENILYDQKVDERYKEWMKGVRGKAFIKINL